MATTFSIGDALSYGWNAMKRNFVLFLYILLTFIAFQVLSNIGKDTAVGIVIAIIVLLITMILKLGVMRIVLDVIDRRKVSYRQLFSQAELFPDYLIGTILYILIVIGGLILLIVPGIIWAIKFQYFSYYIVDKKMSPMDALRRSAKMTYGHKWNLFLFWLAIIGINIVGLLALVIGLFATIPTSIVANGTVYRELESRYAVTERAVKRSDKTVKPKTAKKKR